MTETSSSLIFLGAKMFSSYFLDISLSIQESIPGIMKRCMEDALFAWRSGEPRKSVMKKLPSSTIRRLRTDTVVVDVHSAVKELIENALDAGTAAPYSIVVGQLVL
jgi:hypothetical protein